MSVITNFVEHYQGPKLAILATGGGMGLAQIASVPTGLFSRTQELHELRRVSPEHERTSQDT